MDSNIEQEYINCCQRVSRKGAIQPWRRVRRAEVCRGEGRRAEEVKPMMRPDVTRIPIGNDDGSSSRIRYILINVEDMKVCTGGRYPLFRFL
jgi:hypothetical protein